MLNYWLVAMLFFIQAALFAPWMRRTRAVTPLDAIRLRFGPIVEQICVYTGFLGAFVWSGVFLLTLATFVSAVFGIGIVPIIVVLGIVILFYSVSGGSWSVQITDNLQSFMLIPMTIVMAVLALDQIGGIGGLLDGIRDAGLTADFAMIKSMDHTYSAGSVAKVKPMFYTMPWLAAMMFSQFVAAANIRSSYRYLSIKTGNEARKAALLAGTLTLVGSFIWVVPVMVGRLKFGGLIEALDMKYPADGAYAVTAKQLLPPGMLGLVIVAMFSATMSSMDSNLTGTAGLLVRNLYVPLMRALKKKPLDGKPLLRLTQTVNLGLALWAIGAALIFYKFGQGGIFNMMVMILALIGIPTGMPFVVSLLMRRVPFWGPIVGMVFGFAASVFMTKIAFISPKSGFEWVFGRAPYYHDIVFVVGGFSLIPTVLTRLFWSTASEAYRKRVDYFFKLIHTPVDVEKELGESLDHSQLKTVGGLGMLLSSSLVPLVIYGFFKSDSALQKGCALFVFLFVFVLCALMYYKGRKATDLATEAHAKHLEGAEPGDGMMDAQEQKPAAD